MKVNYLVDLTEAIREARDHAAATAHLPKIEENEYRDILARFFEAFDVDEAYQVVDQLDNALNVGGWVVVARDRVEHTVELRAAALAVMGAQTDDDLDLARDGIAYVLHQIFGAAEVEAEIAMESVRRRPYPPRHDV
jgi:hypothetical protein